MQQRRRSELHMHRVFVRVVVLAVSMVPVAAFAQEDLEPRTVGSRGVTTVGLSGFIDGLSSSDTDFPTHVTMQADVGRFLTSRIAVRGGLIGSTTIGEDEDDIITGPGAAALSARGSALWYFTPQSMASLYAGIEYRAQLTRRAESDAGSALAMGGVEASLSSRASVFVQGGYGVRLTRGDEGERQWRLAGDIGFRIRF